MTNFPNTAKHSGHKNTYRTRLSCAICADENSRPMISGSKPDALVEAVTNLEVAVDDYTHGVYVNATNPDPEDVPVSTLRNAIVKASVAVAAAMTDGDVSLVNVEAAVAVIPVEIREPAARAEIEWIRSIRN